MNEIKEFRGKYFFLSNFFETPVTWPGITYQNNEAALKKVPPTGIWSGAWLGD